ncbi:hypothetical protein ACQCU1_15760 [Sutcliffiella horikoshii]|uniref:hypothetical protein n=1 Tax=Sutcliffiella horikoshii TaxID=79883 RepID=UPI003CFAC391
MQFKNRKLSLWFVAMVIGVFFVVFNFINSSFYINGNDEESIIQTIQSLNLFEDCSIEIVEIKDIGEERLVAFLSNNLPTYIHFNKDKFGNYKWRSAEKKEEPLSHFLISLSNGLEEDYHNLLFLTIATIDNEIPKMELGVNQHVFLEEFVLNKNSATWTEMPKEEKHLTYSYKYYDRNDKLIENED